MSSALCRDPLDYLGGNTQPFTGAYFKFVQSELIDRRDAGRMLLRKQLIDQHIALRVFDGKTIVVMPLLDGHTEESGLYDRSVFGPKCPRKFYFFAQLRAFDNLVCFEVVQSIREFTWWSGCNSAAPVTARMPSPRW